LKTGTSAINFEIRAKQRLLWNASERGNNRFFLFRGRGADVEHIYFDLRLGWLLGGSGYSSNRDQS
jgi:hypothetical protein